MALIELKKVFVKTSQSHFRLEVRMKDNGNFKYAETGTHWEERIRWLINEVMTFQETVKNSLAPIGYKWVEIYKCDGKDTADCMVRMSKDGSSLIGYASGDLHAPFGELAEEKLKDSGAEIEEGGVC